ncbi:MAG: hypothetical protein K2M48_04785, partial [Clostridiales bacterium]|nr:hypothetical protein [Clostridiales bacterium]
RPCPWSRGRADVYKRHLEDDVKNSAYEIIGKKGATYYGIAAAVRRICESIVRDEHSIMPVSTLVCGHYGLDDVYISVPALIGSNGVEDILDVNLSRVESLSLKRSADTIASVLDDIGVRTKTPTFVPNTVLHSPPPNRI